MVETARRILFSELKELRREFGPGKAGSWAFRIIARGTECEGIVNTDGKEQKCTKRATLTVDMDTPRVGDLTQIASCGDCREYVESRLERESLEHESRPRIEVNGWNRS